MLCEVCNKAEATVHLTDVSNNFKNEIHICEACANEKGTTIKSHMNPDPALPEIKAANLVTSDLGETDPEEGELVCPSCGISYRKFRSNGKFGCPDDYAVFGRHVVQLLDKIHHRVQHVGKVPSRANRHLALQEEVNRLREELGQAIESEQYERAAEIRDRIYGLEGRLKKK